MAGGQTVRRDGIEMQVRPDFWLRRLMPFQVYLDRTNPMFRFRVRRSPDSSWNLDYFTIAIVLGSGTKRSTFNVTMPNLKDGNWHSFRFPVNVAMVGWTEIWWVLPSFGNPQHETLYAYPVRAEDAVGWAFLSILIAAGVGVAVHFLFG